MSRPDIARVVLLPTVGGLSELDYRLPAALQRDDLPGCRVLLPLGRQRVLGLVCELVDRSLHQRLKEVEAVIDDVPILDRSLLQLCRWMADYYMASLAEVVATALPGALRIETERRVRLSSTPDAALNDRDRTLVAALQDGPRTTRELMRSLDLGGPELNRRIAALRRKGLVEVDETLREHAPTKHLRFYEVERRRAANAESALHRRPALAALYRYLRDHPLRRASLPELRASFPGVTLKLKQLTGAGLVRASEEEVYRAVAGAAAPTPDRAVTPTADQRDALAAIAAVDGFAAFLLWGVTGSGKTEVYLRAIAAALAKGRTALVLVPEISLTHQLVDRLQARFGPRVAVLHSSLSVGERWDEWRRIARGEAPIVVGARSAVFAPLPRLGLIVVDEEHDSSYKQDEGVRHHGRDVAVVRARIAQCPIVLGSATPSMESFHNAGSGRYQLLELRQRVESRALPAVEIVDLRKSVKAGAPVLSPTLTAALQANFAARGQSLVFLNRRGFASAMQCQACGDVITCPNCGVALTYHRAWQALRCHHCDHTVPAPRQCPVCGEAALTVWGVGTEQIESTLRTLLPGARVARMDRDTMSRKGTQRALLSAWAAGDVDVLIGTQMITKGHDIPGVTLVGVVLADLSLNFPDFRAAERTFQLLTQVAGRAGRGDRPGRVIVQTLQPDHFSLRHAAAHDFGAFAAAELTHRRELGYPPFSRLVLVRVEGERLAAVERVARAVADQLRRNGGRGLAVLGPAPAPIERLRGRHRWQVLCRAAGGATLRRQVAAARDQLRAAARAAAVRLIVDVDPQSML
ncbi:MAG TPA: primosomal protein N' [Candidatus Kryptonia bacterium]|nr:primosomal protein N' [Candidatus Kryptonia bacterium]